MADIKPVKSKLTLSFIVFLIFLLFTCGVGVWQVSQHVKLPGLNSREHVEISIIYAPESELYLKEAIEAFNTSFEDGIHPVTGEKLDSEAKGIRVVGESGSSGTIRSYIVNAVNRLNTDQVAKPTIFAPSVSHWLRLVNYETGKEVFTLDEAQATANAPVVIAIWESRLNLIKAKNPGKEIGWEELIQVLRSKNGWADYSSNIKRKKVYYGHTDPAVSSTALSTLISEYFASAKYISKNKDLEQLTIADVKNKEIEKGVNEIEKLIKHYSSRTTEFKEYIAQGPDYLDFVALEENDLIYINQGKTEYKPPEKLVALYPKEGTFIHEHPFAIPNADWVSEEQREAAEVFTDYVLSDEVQRKVLENGFRPASESVTIESPISPEYGVDPAQPKVVLNAPTPEVISTVQLNWNFVKKKSEVYMLVDTSGSMDGEKIQNAREALRLFIEKLPAENRVGLVTFSETAETSIQMEPLESNKEKITSGVSELYPSGTTALYDGLLQSIKNIEQQENKDDVIRAILLLSDGKDTASKATLGDVVEKLQASQTSDTPILVIPIAYGGDADISALNAIARASSTRVQTGETDDIDKLLEVVSSYF